MEIVLRPTKSCETLFAHNIRLFSFLIILANVSPYAAEAQYRPYYPHQHRNISYMHRLSEFHKQELHNIAIRLEHSIDADKYVCDGYFDYVCGRNRPLFSILGHLPQSGELILLLKQLQEDPEQFEAKEKLFDFFISCNSLKSLDDCYYESFEYFKPLFGYIITKKHINSSSYEVKNFVDILDRFLTKAKSTQTTSRDVIRIKLATLKEKFRMPQIYFRANDLNYEYRELSIYRKSYKHNIKNLELYRKTNSTYEYGVQRTMLDWSLYLYQSRNKPMSYFYATLNVHLWMTLYNSTERQQTLEVGGLQRLLEVGECLKLPQFVNVLNEARILAVVYLKSFRNAWEGYRDWITASTEHQEIYDEENEILEKYRLNNKRLFFTLYAQNFCEFGRDLAENVFYLGLKQNQDFFKIYSCNYKPESFLDCI
uniref:Peptidase M13 N-terminal domain-containing protein n=1 Tax=Glossina pallidipes TaxID=7398 RepID=A0A1A9ZT47_GLOPL